MGDYGKSFIEVTKEGKRINLVLAKLDDVLEHLNITGNGLTSEQAAHQLQIYGFNKPPEEKKESDAVRFLSFLWTPFYWMLETAAVMAIIMPVIGRRSPNWEVFLGVVLLLLLSTTLDFLAQSKACNAAKAPKSALAIKTKVFRDGKWTELDATHIVPGDRIFLQWGDIVPADARILSGEETGVYHFEQPCGCKFVEDEVYSGSSVTDGEAEAIVIRTGKPISQPLHYGIATQDPLKDQHISLVGRFCIYLTISGLILELIIMLVLYKTRYTDVIENFLVLLVGGVQFMMPTVISVSLSVASERASEQGAITRVGPTIFWKLAMIDMIFCSNSGILTYRKPVFDKNRIQVFENNMDKEQLILLAARSSRIEHQDSIDAAIVELLAKPNEARSGIQEMHFLPFHQDLRRTVLTYVDAHGCWHRASKGPPERILELCNCPENIRQMVQRLTEEFARDGLQTLAVAQQETTKEIIWLPWQFVGLMPFLDPSRGDSVETIEKVRMLGLDVKMITACDSPITRETCRRLGLGSTVVSFTSWSMSVSQGIPMNFTGISEVDFAYKKSTVVWETEKKNGRKCIMIGGGRHNMQALMMADIGVCFADSTDVCKANSDIILTEPKLGLIVSIILTSRASFERIRGYTICAVSINIYVVVVSVLITLIWNFSLSPFMILIISILNYGTVMATFQDPVKSHPIPCWWKVKRTIRTGVVLGTHLVMSTAVFFWFAGGTNFFSDMFRLESLRNNNKKLMASLFLQMSISSQVLLFVVLSESWFFSRCFGRHFIFTSVVSQIVGTLIAVYADWLFACVEGVGWHWAGFIWLYTLLLVAVPLQLINATINVIHKIDENDRFSSLVKILFRLTHCNSQPSLTSRMGKSLSKIGRAS